MLSEDIFSFCRRDTFPTHSFTFTSELFKDDQWVNFFLLCFQLIAVNLSKF